MVAVITVAPIVFLIGRLLWRRRPAPPRNQDIERLSNENVPDVHSGPKEYIAMSPHKSKNEGPDHVSDTLLAQSPTRPPSYHLGDGDEASSLKVSPANLDRNGC